MMGNEILGPLGCFLTRHDEHGWRLDGNGRLMGGDGSGRMRNTHHHGVSMSQIVHATNSDIFYIASGLFCSALGALALLWVWTGWGLDQGIFTRARGAGGSQSDCRRLKSSPGFRLNAQRLICCL